MWMVGAAGGATEAPLRNPANLNPDDLQVFGMVMARVWHQLESHYQAWRAGTLDDEEWSKLVPFVHQHLRSDAGLARWEFQRQGWHTKGFTDFVDNEIRALRG